MSWKLIGCGICSISLLLLFESASASARLDLNGIGESVSRPTDAPDDDDSGWASFVARYGKKYMNQTEANERYATLRVIFRDEFVIGGDKG